ncbi:MAG: peptidoglycan binding domain-containing protein, partial [Chloroflexia bacterium]
MDKDELNPQWPQRPEGEAAEQSTRPSPRLDPSVERSSNSSSGWTSTPTQSNLADRSRYPESDDAKSTRALPLVDRGSRFSRTGTESQGGRVAQPVQRPTPAPAVQPSATRSTDTPQQPQPQPRPTPRVDNSQPASRPSAPPNNQQKLYGQGVQQRQTPAPQYAPAPHTRVDPSKSFLSVDIEGEKKRRFGAWILWILGGIILVALIGGTAFALAWQGQYSGKIYAGVNALGIDLGGKTPAEAEKLLNDRVKAFSSEPVLLDWNGKEWKPSLDDLGVSIGIDDTLDDAFKVGRDADFFGSIADQWTASQTGWQVGLTVQLSEPTLQTYLDGIAATEINQD